MEVGLWVLVELARLLGPGWEWAMALSRLCHHEGATEGLDFTQGPEGWGPGRRGSSRQDFAGNARQSLVQPLCREHCF